VSQSTRRQLNQRRIAVATRGLAIAAALATAAFAAAAAHTGKAAANGSSAGGGSSVARSDSDDSGFGSFTPSQSDLQSSSGPAVAGSGGS